MRRLIATVALILMPLSAAAQVAVDRVAGLHDALGLPEVVAIMREEGLRYGGSIEEQMFPGSGGAAWAAVVSDIYRVEAMDAAVRSGMASGLSDAGVRGAEAFFRSDLGRRIVSLEVSARRALLDATVEAESRAAAADLRQAGGPRVDLVTRFSDANQLVEQNVAGALNANLAFYQGLDAGGAFPQGMTESEILADVWGQEPEVRTDTEEWVYSYLLLAYAPLSTDDLDAYIAFSQTEDGRALNRALFAAFDQMFSAISRDLGQAAARFVTGEQL